MDVARLLGGANLQCVRGHVEDQGVFLPGGWEGLALRLGWVAGEEGEVEK